MSLTSALDSLLESTRALTDVLPTLIASDDRMLLATQSRLAEARRHIDAVVAASAAEIDRRSSRELGYDGLAQRLGFQTPERLVEKLSGVSRREASTLVRVGSLDAASPLGISVATGSLSVAAADAIGIGLGTPTEAVPTSLLDDAAARILLEAPSLTLDQLAARARSLRDELDADGVALREEQLRERRYLRLTPQQDGMVRLAGLLDPESASLFTDAFDAVTSPRRGGPRFVDPAKKLIARQLETDPRTLDQLMLDTFVEIVGVAATAPTKVFGLRRPAVRVLVAERDLAGRPAPLTSPDVSSPAAKPPSPEPPSPDQPDPEPSALEPPAPEQPASAPRVGFGHLEATSNTPSGVAVSLATVARYACDSGIQPIVVGSTGDVLRLGHLRRLFGPQQRLALAARDGGCRFPACSRPPSWCEAHHTVPWSLGGRTDVADGILLCRYHHLLTHNNGWTVTRNGTGNSYQLVPPLAVDAKQRPIPMPTKSAAWKEAARAG